MILPIITYPNTPILNAPCEKIDRSFLLSEEIQNLIKDMIETMYLGKGIGLAAPQIGKLIQICVIGKDSFPKKIKAQKGEINLEKDLVIINPTWKKLSRKTVWDTEGCLSIPEIYGKVKRYKFISVDAIDTKGEEISFDAVNFFARVIQHEIEHLSGKLFIDIAKDIYKVE